MLEIVRIARFTRGRIRKLGGHRLADNDRTSGSQQRHTARIGIWTAAREGRATVLSWHVIGINDVLDADWKSMQWSERRAALSMRIGLIGLGQGVLGVEIGPSLDLIISRGDPIEIGLG